MLPNSASHSRCLSTSAALTEGLIRFSASLRSSMVMGAATSSLLMARISSGLEVGGVPGWEFRVKGLGFRGLLSKLYMSKTLKPES